MSQKAVSLKALVDRTNNRVVFAESDGDFVDVLFSFLTMPMGTIIRLIHKRTPAVRIGSMNNLYESIANMDERQFQNGVCKTMLLYPRNRVAAQCRSLKLEIVKDEPPAYFGCNSKYCTQYDFVHYSYAICSCGQSISTYGRHNNTPYSGVFVKGMTRLIVTDELHIMPPSTKASISLLSKVGVADKSIIEECNFNIGVDEVLNLLKCSLTSKMPLTETFLKQNADPDELHKVELDQVHHVKSRMKEPASNENGKVHIKLIISKSKNMFCYAEAREDFVNLLFSFLTVPLGYVVKEMHNGISKGCISHLYNSIYELDNKQFLKSDEHTTMLVSPKLAPEFSHENNASGIDFFSHSNESPLTVEDPKSCIEKAIRGGFMSSPALFTVTDNLIITPISAISCVSVLKKLKVDFDDIEECIVKVGREEALQLLVASFVSESAITSTFFEELSPES